MFKLKKKSSLLLIIMAISSTILELEATQSMTYIIHMDKDKVDALDQMLGDGKRWYETVIDSVGDSDTDDEEPQTQLPEPPELLYVYEYTVSGFAARLSPKQLETVNKVDGFLSATPDDMFSLHTTHTPQFLGLQNGKGLWQAPNLASDVIVGIIDTGIWPEHVSFSNVFSGANYMSPIPARWKGHCENGPKFSSSNCNKKLIGARSFFKGYEAAAGRINETTDYRSPRHSAGHGTHTASTAAGNIVTGANLFGMAKGAAGGMRYTARIATYKVCWQTGCASSDILAAMDQAVSDGVDVLSLSLGGISKPYYSDNMAIAALGAIQKGVFVSCSAGNSGPFASTVANTAPWIMTVAASYLDRSFPTTVKLGNGQVFKGSSLYRGIRSTKNLSLVYGKAAPNRTDQDARYCISGSLNPKLVKGKIVVCQQGINSRTGKGEQVNMAGGMGMLLLNSEDEGEELFADPHILPATSLGVLAANAIKNYVNVTKRPMASIIFEGTLYGSPAPIIAAFSSRGPSPIAPDVIKPDVTAPGMDILAAWPPTVSPTRLMSNKRSVEFNIISGTSMSCPHVSGVAALLKSVHPNWSPAAIKSALMTSSYTLNNKRHPIADAKNLSNSEPASPFAFGSGHVNPEKASDPGLVYDITIADYLNYICTLNYTSSQIALLARRSYICPRNGLTQVGDLNYPSFALNFVRGTTNATITYKRTVTNVGKPKSNYGVKVSQPDGVMMNVSQKKLKFKKVGQKLSYKVSFMTTTTLTASSFGSLVWVSGKYSVRSPIAINWL